MLTYKNLAGSVFPITEYREHYIDHTDDGGEKLVVNFNILSDIYREIQEEGTIITEKNRYIVKKISDGKVECELDFDFLKTFYTRLSAEDGTFTSAMQKILPAGWSIRGSALAKTLTYELENTTGDKAAEYFISEYGASVKWDVLNRVLTVYSEDDVIDGGVYITDELNLRDISFRGDTTEFVTRLYCYGKDGVGIEEVNGGLPYIEDFTYSNKVVCGVFSDTRYQLPKNILASGRIQLNKLAHPVRSYECDIIDLAKQNSEYDFLDISLYTLVTLIDNRNGIAVKHRVVRYREYPDEPARNVITLATAFEDVCDIVEDARDIRESLNKFVQVNELTAAFDVYVDSESGRASIVSSLSGIYATKDEITGVIYKTELDAEIGAYIDTQSGTAKIVNAISGTYQKQSEMGSYVEKTDLDAQINAYIDTQAGTSKIVQAVSGTYQKQSDMAGYAKTSDLLGYVEKTDLDASIGAYIDTQAGTSKVVTAVSGTYQKQADMVNYAKTSDLLSYVTKTDLEAEIGAYVDTQAGTAKIVSAVSGTYQTKTAMSDYAKKSDLSAYVSQTDLSAGIASYIDTQEGQAKVVTAVSGTYVTQSGMNSTLNNYATKSDIPSLAGYVTETELDAEIGAYIDTASGTAKIISAVSGTYQKKSEMSGYVTTTNLNASIGTYIDSTAGTSKIISACSGTYAKSSDLSGYAKTSALTTIEQSVSSVEAKISLSASYGSGSIGSNVRALLTLVTNADSSSIKLKASAVEIDGSLYLKASDYLASGTTTIKGSKIQTSDLYIQQLRTASGMYIIDYAGNVLSVGGGTSTYGNSFAEFSYIDMMVEDGIRIGYGVIHCGFYYESAGFTLRPATSSSSFSVGSSTYPVRYIYCDYLYVDGVRVTGSGSSSSTDALEETDITKIYAVYSTTKYIQLNSSYVFVPSSSGFGIGTTTYPFQTLYIGTGSAYHWKFEASAILPSSTSTSYFNIGSSTYPVNNLYARKIYLNGTELKSESSSSSSSNPTKLYYSSSSTTYYVGTTSDYALVPSHCTSYSHWNLGSSSYYWYDCYLGYGSTRIGYNTSSKLGFFGTTPVAKQTVSSTASVSTLITALKAYGLI